MWPRWRATQCVSKIMVDVPQSVYLEERMVDPKMVYPKGESDENSKTRQLGTVA